MDGISKTRLYTIFSGMKQRCYNQNCDGYRFYGGKGITICGEWMGEHGLSLFIEWALNNGYEENLTIDRINAEGPYSPDNCRWITQSENSSRVEHPPKHIPPMHSPGNCIRMDRRVKALMDEKGLKKVDLRKMGFSPNVVDKVLSGPLDRSHRVDTETINRLCEVLNCQPGDIMEYIPEE